MAKAEGYRVLKITGDDSGRENNFFIEFLLCRSLVSFVCQSLSIKEEVRGYLVCVPHMRIRIHGRK